MKYLAANYRTTVTLLFLLIGISMLWVSCIHDPILGELPTDGEPNTLECSPVEGVCFESSVLPIFVSECAKSGCHDSKSRKEGYILDTYSNIMKRGISPGNAAGSKLYKVLFESGEDRMPPNGSLSLAQKDSIAAWINEGARNTKNCNCFCDSTQSSYLTIIKPMLDNNCAGCHKPGSLGGNIDLSTYAATKTHALNGKLVGSVSHKAGYSAMPQGGKLSDCQITQIKTWVEEGALNN